jgi:hypothetical protein
LGKSKNTNEQIDDRSLDSIEYLMSSDMLKKLSDDAVDEDTIQDNFEELSETSDDITKTLSEKDGVEYFAGNLAKKFRKELPNVGKYTFELKDEEKTKFISGKFIKSCTYGSF